RWKGRGWGGVDVVDQGELGLGEILVPAELFKHTVSELRIAVLDLGVFRVVAVAKQAHLAGGAVRQLLLAFNTEAGAESAATLFDRQDSIVENWRARMTERRRAPAWPRSPVIAALLGARHCLLRAHVEGRRIRHMRLDALRQLSTEPA